MLETGRRPMGRLFYWALSAMCAALVGFCGSSAGQTSTTTIADTVYLADGTAAAGSLIISWPAFVTSSGTAVAGGTTSVTLGANGALSVALVANASATPAGVYYTVIYQLGPGEVKTETWVVPANSPVKLADVRMTPGSGLASAPVSLQYVNSELATKANDSAVVHLTGAETISGTKTFAISPAVPAPMNPSDIASKSYVDTSLSTVGAGSFFPAAMAAVY